MCTVTAWASSKLTACSRANFEASSRVKAGRQAAREGLALMRKHAG